jgi:hypothetical protein
MKRKLVVAGAALAVLAIGGVGAAMALGNGGGDSSVSGHIAHKAIAAALEATGGVKANGVERDDENGAAYEVEVQKRDGSTVDVRLDSSDRVVVVEPDSEQADQGDRAGHDKDGRN